MDLIKHHAKSQFSSTYKVVDGCALSVDELIEHELGAHCTISLHSRRRLTSGSGTDNTVDMVDSESSGDADTVGYHLADSSMLVLSENQDERIWHDHLSPFLNFNFDFDRQPLFAPTKCKSQQQVGVKVPGCFLLRLNRPVVMCVSTLNELQERIGISIFI